MRFRQPSVDERRRLIAESLNVGNPPNKAGDLPGMAIPRFECQIELAVDDIRPYESNPRRADNARFAEIKESIRSSGIRSPLTVTRRPGEEHFIVEAGGNTRLLAIQQLWTETQDARFRKLGVLFRPWRCESHVLISHLIENELRGEMTFWDKATGVIALKARLEAEKGVALSLRQLEDQIKVLGLSVNTATLAHYLFATERLRTLGDAIADLSGLDVKTMQPRLNAMKRYAKTRATLAEADLYATVFEPVFQNAADQYRQSRPFSGSAVCEACEEALARQLGEPVANVRCALDGSVPSPKASPVIPPACGGRNRTAEPAALVPTTLSSPSRPESAVSTANAGTVFSDGHAQTGDALAPNDEIVVVRSRIVEQVQSFASLTGIRDCLCLDAVAPLGFYMNRAPVVGDEKFPPPNRHQAWWLLAVVAGQLDHSVSMAVPEGSTQPDRATPFAFDTGFVNWLVDAHDQTASAFWHVLTLVRESRFSTAARRPITVPDPARRNA